MRFLTLKTILLGALGLALFSIPTDALRALGLGEARVGSYLGQPLDISVRLLEADDAALDTLTVAPATPGDHERLGVPADALALGLEITVDRRVDPPQLRIRSRRNVNDPVVQVLVDARWSNGRVLREYTLFLDPPLIDAPPPRRRAVETAPEATPAEAVEPEREAVPTPPRPAPRPAPEERPEPVAEPVPPLRDDVVGPIGAGETLWGVAMAWRPDTTLTMNQVMLAIFERNPQAFIGGNVNRLRRGAELTMPDVASVRATSTVEADRRIREQMQAWRQETRTTDVPVVADVAVPDVERAPEPEPEPLPPEVVHRLEVVPPDQEDLDDGVMVSAEEIQQARDRTRRLEDQMYAEELETDLFYRDLESIRDAIDSGDAAGLAIAEEELALFEMRLREARRAREEAAQELAEVAEVEEPVAAVPPVDERTAVDAPVPVDQAPVVADEPPLPAADPQSRWPLWLWVILGVVVLGLIAGLVWFLLLRGQRATSQTTTDDAGVALTRARARVASKPQDLTAHLSLLGILAEKDDSAAFSSALDDMYKHVDDDSDTAWQQALEMATVNAPDHPLLTPPETIRRAAKDDEEGLDERTREMLGILDQDARPAADEDPDSEIDIDDTIDVAGRKDEVDEDRFGTRRQAEAAAEEEEIEGVDHDLAELSKRLDEDEAEEDPEDADNAFDFDFSNRSPDSTPAEDRESERESEEESDDTVRFPDASDQAFGPDERATDPDMSDFERDLLGATGDPDEDDLDFSEHAADGDDERRDDVADHEDDTQADNRAVPDESVDKIEPDPDEELQAFLRSDETDLDAEQENLAAEPDEDATEAAGEATLSDDDAEVKLDLARAYLSMDDPESAQTLLEEILAGGSQEMRQQARQLLDGIN